MWRTADPPTRVQIPPRPLNKSLGEKNYENKEKVHGSLSADSSSLHYHANKYATAHRRITFIASSQRGHVSSN